MTAADVTDVFLSLPVDDQNSAACASASSALRLPESKRLAKPKSVFARRSPALLAHARALRKAYRTQRLQHSLDSNKHEEWNARTLRVGDMIRENHHGQGESKHPRAYTNAGIIRAAFALLRMSSRAASSSDPVQFSKHTETCQPAVAAAIRVMQEARADKRLQACMEAGMKTLVLCRHYDATGMHVNFGSLSDQVHPHARYLLSRGCRLWDVPQTCPPKEVATRTSSAWNPAGRPHE